MELLGNRPDACLPVCAALVWLHCRCVTLSHCSTAGGADVPGQPDHARSHAGPAGGRRRGNPKWRRPRHSRRPPVRCFGPPYNVRRADCAPSCVATIEHAAWLVQCSLDSSSGSIMRRMVACYTVSGLLVVWDTTPLCCAQVHGDLPGHAAMRCCARHPPHRLVGFKQGWNWGFLCIQKTVGSLLQQKWSQVLCGPAAAGDMLPACQVYSQHLLDPGLYPAVAAQCPGSKSTAILLSSFLLDVSKIPRLHRHLLEALRMPLYVVVQSGAGHT